MCIGLASHIVPEHREVVYHNASMFCSVGRYPFCYGGFSSRHADLGFE